MEKRLVRALQQLRVLNTNYVSWWPFDADHTLHASIEHRFSTRLERS
jgi:hypothetical protein